MFKQSILCLVMIMSVSMSATQIVSVHSLMHDTDDIRYTKCHDSFELDFIPFPLRDRDKDVPAHHIIPETFILSIAHGAVHSSQGLTVIMNGNTVMQELIWPWSRLLKGDSVDEVIALPKTKIDGRVVVLAQEGQNNYYHWMLEVIPKLALLELKGIEYDWLYVNTRSRFMQETLQLFGVDSHKIIAVQDNSTIEADELIVPSFVSLSCTSPLWVISYLRNKILPHAQQLKGTWHPKLFISRKKAAYRRILNEDEIFTLLEPLGFVRYYAEDFSFMEQVAMFCHADVIISAHGAGLTNLIFSQPGTQVVELFQAHEDGTYWYLSQTLGLQHRCVKTIAFEKNSGYTDTYIPLSCIENLITEKSIV